MLLNRDEILGYAICTLLCVCAVHVLLFSVLSAIVDAFYLTIVERKRYDHRRSPRRSRRWVRPIAIMARVQI